MKKITGILLSVIILMVSMSICGSAVVEEPKMADDSQLVVDRSGKLIKYLGNELNVRIPEQVTREDQNGVYTATIVEIGENAFSNNIKRVDLPDSVKIIGGKAFKGCGSLESISANCVEEIKFDAFAECVVLKEINLPKLTIAGARAFEMVGKEANEMFTISLPNFEKAAKMCFAGCGATYIELPKIKTLGEDTFNCCSQLLRIDLPLVENLDGNANIFQGCTAIKHIGFPQITDVPKGTFDNCASLEEIYFPKVKSIGESAFSNCTLLSQISLDNCQKIGKTAFENCKTLERIVLPKVTSIVYDSFEGCDSLVYLELPKLKKIEAEINFCNFPNSLEYFIAPELTELPACSFYSTALKSAELNGIEKISDSCFAFCKNLENISLPNAEIIEADAFNNTTNLKNLDVPNVKTIEGSATFKGVSGAFINAPGLHNASVLPYGNSILLSSAFESVDSVRSNVDLTIYGTPGTYANSVADEYGYKFIPVPFIKTEIVSTYEQGDEPLSIDAIGFDLDYQWYGKIPEYNIDEPIEGATSVQFDPNEYNRYEYYYCIITSTDADTVPQKTKTELCINNSFDISSVPANYSRLFDEIEKIPADLSIYTEESVAQLQLVLDSIDYDLNITEQEKVDEYTNAVNNAVNNLKKECFIIRLFRSIVAFFEKIFYTTKTMPTKMLYCHSNQY